MIRKSLNYKGKILSVTAEAANKEDLTDVEVSDGSQEHTRFGGALMTSGSFTMMAGTAL